MKGWGFHILVKRAKVICQDCKDFNREINNIKYYFLFNQYPPHTLLIPLQSQGEASILLQVENIMAQSLSHKPGIFLKKFKCSGNLYSGRNVFRTKHKFCGHWRKHGMFEVQRKKPCVYSIPDDCDKCYISETSRSVEERINEHRHNRRSLLERSKGAHAA